MKILQINCVYKEGSTGKIVELLHNKVIENGDISIVCYGRGEKTTDSNIFKVCSEVYAKWNNLCSRITGIMYGGCFWSTRKLKKIINKENPDIVHIHCINGYFVNIYNIVEWLKKEKIPTVLTLHAEFMYTANCGYALDCEKWRVGCGKCPRLRKETLSYFFDNTATSFKKMRKSFEDFNEGLLIVSVSPWLMHRAKSSEILKEKKHICIQNGINTNVFNNMKINKDKYIKKENEKVILHVTAMFSDEPNHLKGGEWLLKLANTMKEENVRFLVVGKTNVKSEIPINVELLGEIKDQNKLAELYNVADLVLLLSKKETFSMIVAESLCCGTPVVGFQAGAPEQIAIPEYSEFVKQGEIENLKNKIEKWLNNLPDKSIVATEAVKKYSSEVMVNNYIKVYEDIR